MTRCSKYKFLTHAVVARSILQNVLVALFHALKCLPSLTPTALWLSALIISNRAVMTNYMNEVIHYVAYNKPCTMYNTITILKGIHFIVFDT